MTLVNRPSGLVMISWVLGSVILSYGFTSCLIASLTKPAKEKPMETWQDLLDNNYTILTAMSMTPFGEIIGTVFDENLMVNIFSNSLIAD